LSDRLADRIALITGAGNGIGRASALALAADGADVFLIDMEADGVAEAADAIRETGRRAEFAVADGTDEAALTRAVATAETAFGRIDILFNNIGQSAREKASEFHESEEATWRFVIETSLMVTMRCSRLVIPGMRDRGHGRVINMSSESAFFGDVGLVDYAAAKMGVVGFTRALARELAPHGVTVNTVCPGPIRTRAQERLRPEVIQRINDSIPMGFIGEPEDVAGVVAFLAGDGSRYITGQSILIDGGRWMV
jgi:NAD(P)-dependent dehydrogenase (short-subunit alcohol dehydrogenase family)